MKKYNGRIFFNMARAQWVYSVLFFSFCFELVTGFWYIQFSHIFCFVFLNTYNIMAEKDEKILVVMCGMWFEYFLAHIKLIWKTGEEVGKQNIL